MRMFCHVALDVAGPENDGPNRIQLETSRLEIMKYIYAHEIHQTRAC